MNKYKRRFLFTKCSKLSYYFAKHADYPFNTNAVRNSKDEMLHNYTSLVLILMILFPFFPTKTSSIQIT